MSVKAVDSFEIGYFALTPSPAPTGAGEGSVALGFEALPSDQRLYLRKCSVRFSTLAWVQGCPEHLI